MINLTSAAVNEISKIIEQEETQYIRLAVQGGGCAGFTYQFSFARATDDDDVVIQDKLVVDSLSLQYLNGATIDYVEELMGARFNIDNPNATTTCGCGSSFTA